MNESACFLILKLALEDFHDVLTLHYSICAFGRIKSCGNSLDNNALEPENLKSDCFL